MAAQPLFGTAILALATVSGVTGFALAAYALGRQSRAARAYALVSGVAACWSVAYAAQLAAPSDDVVHTVYPLVVIFSTVSPFAWFAFTLVWTDNTEWFTHPLVLAVFVEPFVFLVLFLTGVAPMLVDPSVPTTTFAGLTLVEATTQPLETLHVLFIYAVIVGATVLLGHTYLGTRQVYRRQTGLLIAGSSIVFAISVAWFVGLSPHPALDLTPVLMVGNAVVAGYAIFGLGALRQLPVTATSIIDALDDPIVVVDRDGDLTDFNDTAADLIPGLTAGTNLEDALPGIQAAVDSGDTYSVPGERDRTRYDVSVTPAINSAGETLAYTYHLRNVTHRVRREETLSALHVASRRFTTAETRTEVATIARDALVEALDFEYAGVLLYDPEADHLAPTAITDALADAMGGAGPIEPGESFLWDLYERDEHYIGPVPDGDRQYEDVPISRVAVIPLGDHGILAAGTVDVDHDSLSDDRFIDLLAATTQASLDRADREAELRAQRREVAAQHERIEFFNSLLRHDLLNGLMVVRGHLDLLVDRLHELEPEAADDENWRSHLDVVDRWTDDMADLIQRIRSVIDTLSGEGPHVEPVALGPLLAEKAEKLDASYDTVTVTTAVDDIDVLADDLLGDVIGNVLFNAIEHHDRDTQHVEITTRVTDDSVSIRIADDGPGIPDEAKEAVFEKDYTTRGNGTLGFGLYFVAVTIDRYGGTVRVEDNDGRGSTVVIEIPRDTARANTDDLPEYEPRSPSDPVPADETNPPDW